MNSCLKKIRPFLFVLLTIASFAALFVGVSKAADQTIICGSSGCSGPGEALFNETNIAPGNSITRTLHVSNVANPDSCNLTMAATTPSVTGRVGSNDFPFRLFTVIKDGASDVYGLRDGADKATNTKTLGSLPGDTPISLGPIAAGASKDYNWTVTFDKGADNNYQEATAKFDFSLTFVCGNPSTPNGGGVGGASAPTVCQDTPPAGAPVLKGITLGVNSATLAWSEAPDPVSYYLIAYGTSHGVYQYGNPNIGGKGTTSYTVTNLSGGTTYYFVVRAGNGCAPGPFSNELYVIPSGKVLAGPVTGFLPGVLGVENQVGEKATQEVKGIECLDKNYLWWLPLVIEVGFLAVYLYWLTKKRIRTKRWFIIPLVVAATSQIVHEILGCNCSTGNWCSKYIFINLLILAIFLRVAAYSIFKKRAK
jgi:hypothetical protein